MSLIDCRSFHHFHIGFCSFIPEAVFTAHHCVQMKDITMAWTKPTNAEVPASMEINMYASAKEK